MSVLNWTSLGRLLVAAALAAGTAGVAAPSAAQERLAAADAAAGATSPEPLSADEMEVLVARIALYPDDAPDYDELMKGADEAMYEAKRDTKALGGGFRRATPAA